MLEFGFLIPAFLLLRLCKLRILELQLFADQFDQQVVQIIYAVIINVVGGGIARSAAV